MAIFDFDLRYRDGKWEAEATWRDGSRLSALRGYDRRLNLTGTGKKPEEAVESLVSLVHSLLGETERRIREDFKAFEF